MSETNLRFFLQDSGETILFTSEAAARTAAEHELRAMGDFVNFTFKIEAVRPELV